MGNSDIFVEWDTYAKRKKLHARDINIDSIIRNSSSKLIAISGIRRSGKSSLLMLIAQHLSNNGEMVGYVNVEDSRISGSKTLLDDILKWFGDEGFLLLDEITSAVDWEGWLARNHELLKGKLHIIVSSSVSLIKPSKPLRGRILNYEIFPLTLPEFLQFRNTQIEKTTAGKGRIERAMMEYLKYGGFPEVALTQDPTDKVRIIASYFKDIVGLDVADRSGQEISTVEMFGKYVVESTTFSASKCLNFMKTLGYKIGKERILQLEKYTQDGYLFFFVPIFSYNIKDKAQYPRKAYLGDLGFYYGITGKEDFGKTFENLVFLELKRRFQDQAEIHYWKNASGLETDFVVKKGTHIVEAVQVAYEITNDKTEKREIKGLVECVKSLKPDKYYILTKDFSKTVVVDGIKIHFVPISNWLL
jgi:predicted AAA+ superfamily ATPase